MKKAIFFFLFLFFAISIFAQQYIVSFKVKNMKEVYKLPEYVIVDNITNNKVVAYLYGNNYEKFKQLGYEYKLQDHPSKGRNLTMATTIDQMADWNRYPTHDVYLEMMNKFATDYPNLCRLDTMGYSVQNRPVVVLKITDNPDADEAEPEFYYTGQMHGDELISGIIFVRLIDYLLSNYGTDTRVTNLVDNYEIWINPISNPDGVYRSGDHTVSGATRANANDVDLNRNFPSPTKPNPTYVNEPEIQMQLEFSANHNFVMSANGHSGVELVNYPWDSWTSDENAHADYVWWEHVARNYANVVHSNAPATYMEARDNGVTHGGDWYIVDGGRQDHMGYYKYCRELTIELSDNKMLDCEKIPAHWDYNRDAMLGYIEECRYGVNGIVTNTNNEPLNAKIFITNHDKDNSEVYTDPVVGDYYRPLENGTYDITYSSEGYISQTHTITITDWETTVVKDVVLEQAQQIELSGTVTDATTNSTPLENVEIKFLGTDITPVTTDAEGHYSVTLSENEYQIQASKIGYSTQIQTVTITPTNNVIDFALFPSYTITFEDEIPEEISFANTEWTRDNSQAQEGTYSMRSGNINGYESSTMQLTITTLDGTINFYKKVSSEEDYDKLTFQIDGQEMGNWSGEIDWSLESYPITAGEHTYTWQYAKDVSGENGEDCSWIDYIELPPLLQEAYSVTFIVTDKSSTPLQNADIYLFGYGTKKTDSNGQCKFDNILSSTDSISYKVSLNNYERKNGKILVTNTDIIEEVQLADIIGINEIEKGLKIYPNPTNGIINIETNQNFGSISIYNINGVEIIKKEINTKDEIDLSNYPKGIYMLEFKSETKNNFHKIILK